jgi:Na+-translocating ferredoxin:NAD+ oxidoreductase RnfD subunit
MLSAMNGVLTVVVGAVLAGLFTLAGALYGGRREHAQWLRNTRIVAYRSLVTTVTQMNVATPPSESGRDVMNKVEVFFAAVSAVDIAGPIEVAAAADRLKSAALKYVSGPTAGTKASFDDVSEAEERFVERARSTLRSSATTSSTSRLVRRQRAAV